MKTKLINLELEHVIMLLKSLNNKFTLVILFIERQKNVQKVWSNDLVHKKTFRVIVLNVFKPVLKILSYKAYLFKLFFSTEFFCKQTVTKLNL